MKSKLWTIPEWITIKEGAPTVECYGDVDAITIFLRHLEEEGANWRSGEKATSLINRGHDIKAISNNYLEDDLYPNCLSFCSRESSYKDGRPVISIYDFIEISGNPADLIKSFDEILLED